MRFKDWFYNEMTSTGDVAVFSRIVLPLVRRSWVADLSDSEDEDKPKKRHKKRNKKKDDE